VHAHKPVDLVLLKVMIYTSVSPKVVFYKNSRIFVNLHAIIVQSLNSLLFGRGKTVTVFESVSGVGLVTGVSGVQMVLSCQRVGWGIK
jgi:hypothetical protein